MKISALTEKASCVSAENKSICETRLDDRSLLQFTAKESSRSAIVYCY